MGNPWSSVQSRHVIRLKQPSVVRAQKSTALEWVRYVGVGGGGVSLQAPKPVLRGLGYLPTKGEFEDKNSSQPEEDCFLPHVEAVCESWGTPGEEGKVSALVGGNKRDNAIEINAAKSYIYVLSFFSQK